MRRTYKRGKQAILGFGRKDDNLRAIYASGTRQRTIPNFFEVDMFKASAEKILRRY